MPSSSSTLNSTDVGGGPSTGGGGATGGSSPGAGGIPLITAVLNPTAGTISTTATQLFSTPSIERTAVYIRNTHGSASNFIYVWWDDTVSATINCAILDQYEDITLAVGPGVEVWIEGSGANINYAAAEIVAHVKAN